MCGVAGIATTGTPDPATVRTMCGTLTHRGPDGAGYFSDAHAALGMRRLAIIDVAGGDQPLANEDRSVIAVFNGEIYNFGDLRRELLARGHRFRTGSDGECLVHLYEECGEALVHRLRGMFAFALWDVKRRRLLLARDRVGKKPLYYRDTGSALLFASELKALTAVDSGTREVDPVALHHYLTYQYVPAPWSILRGIRKLPPGHLLSWQDGRVSVRRYWRLDFSPAHRPVSEPEAAERTRELLLEATRIRMAAERPLGAFLSGGIDSSAVVAAMARTTDRPVKTFAIGFDDARYDEREHARTVARRYGTDHHEFVVSTSALTVLPTLAWHFDEPFADSSAIPSYYVAQLSRRHVTVALNGDGGDETFGGYTRYALMARTARLRAPRAAHPALRRLAGLLLDRGPARAPLRKAGTALRMLGETPQDRYARLMSYLGPEQKHELYTDGMRRELSGVDSYELMARAFGASRAGSLPNQLMDVDVHTYLPGDLLVKVDITTMANSLEARSPFLDHHLMEWAARLPASLKVRGSTTKYLLKKALADWLPTELLNRPKQGFGVPLDHWLRTELKELAWDVLTDGTARSRGYFRPQAVRAMLEEHMAGTNHARGLWALIQFELWHRHFADRPLPGPWSVPGPGHRPIAGPGPGRGAAQKPVREAAPRVPPAPVASEPLPHSGD
ncbi:asparagine synthase (glutamine-hydrolyzing) [Streptomyces sp. NPDC127084]|uniref:asparagine synthase (glutamine-hydrolyzing) n=1 Tax=Streptomyces sp. NPDC127084 TaxID=3347133 RepID=UPI00364C817B